MYIKNITRWFFSLSPIKTIYFNFKYLPLKQAWKLPVILENVRLHSLRGEVFIDEDVIYTGMIRIGSPIMINYWCPKKQSDIDLQGGRLVLHKGIKFGLGTHLRVHDNALLNIGRFVCSSSD